MEGGGQSGRPWRRMGGRAVAVAVLLAIFAVCAVAAIVLVVAGDYATASTPIGLGLVMLWFAGRTVLGLDDDEPRTPPSIPN